MHTVSVVLMLIAMLLTLGVLFAGLVGFARGGETSRKHGNRLMRLRVILQFVAICLFLLAIGLSDP